MRARSSSAVVAAGGIGPGAGSARPGERRRVKFATQEDAASAAEEAMRLMLLRDVALRRLFQELMWQLCSRASEGYAPAAVAGAFIPVITSITDFR